VTARGRGRGRGRVRRAFAAGSKAAAKLYPCIDQLRLLMGAA